MWTAEPPGGRILLGVPFLVINNITETEQQQGFPVAAF